MKRRFYLPTLIGILSFTLLCTSSCWQEKPGKATPTSELDFKRKDNVVYINMPTEPNTLNPFLTIQGYARYVHEQIIQSLTEQHPETLEQVPSLASLPTIFKRPDGGVDYTYDLQANANWPNGSPVTAEDVVFTLKILFNPLVNAGIYRPYFSMIENITLNPANEKRFKVETKEPYILSEAAIGSLQIYPEYAYDPDGLLKNIRLSDLLNTARATQLAETNENLKLFAERFNDAATGRDPERVVGSGPFRLVSWEAGQRIRLEAREDYWAKDRNESWLASRPEAIVYQFVEDEATTANALRDQEFDGVVELGVGTFNELQAEPSVTQYYNFHNVPGGTYYSLILNTKDPILSDKKVRRALAYLVDVESLINDNYGGLASRLTGPIVPQKAYYNDQLPEIPFDPAKAEALLREAGWGDANNNGILDKEING
ncbi:MAG: ABC transporter substrate-binding protein, partial [Bacteroidota bacterium]